VRGWEWLALVGLPLVIAASFLLPPLPQDLAYHRFADQRTILGIPHFWNVVSNAPFLLIGAAGLILLLADGGLGPGRRFGRASEKIPFLVLFLGVTLTAFGSAYYHLDPSNERLVWDRLPMAIGFMGLFAAILGERTQPWLGAAALGPLVVLGVGSVLYWHWTEQAGVGNLVPYVAVQFYPLLLIPVLLLFTKPRWTRGGDYLIGLGWYALAKVLELGDAWIYFQLGAVGGHPLKHLAAALGAYWILRMLLLRRPIPEMISA
jgi:hypothetical protein